MLAARRLICLGTTSIGLRYQKMCLNKCVCARVRGWGKFFLILWNATETSQPPASALNNTASWSTDEKKLRTENHLVKCWKALYWLWNNCKLISFEKWEQQNAVWHRRDGRKGFNHWITHFSLFIEPSIQTNNKTAQRWAHPTDFLSTPVQLHVRGITSNQPITWQHLSALGYVDLGLNLLIGDFPNRESSENWWEEEKICKRANSSLLLPTMIKSSHAAFFNMNLAWMYCSL